MPRKIVVNLDREFNGPQIKQACDRIGDYAQRAAIVLRRLSSSVRKDVLANSETLRSLVSLRETLDETTS